MTELPIHGETKIVTYQGKVKRLKFDEGRSFRIEAIIQFIKGNYKNFIVGFLIGLVLCQWFIGGVFLNPGFLGALFGALITGGIALFTYMKQNINDNNKELREKYNNLYSKLIFELFNYIDIRTNFGRGHDIDDDQFDGERVPYILNEIKGKLLYLEPTLLKDLQEVTRFDYFDDLAGFQYQRHYLKLFSKLLGNLLEINKKISVLNKDIVRSAQLYQFRYALWCYATMCFCDYNKAAGLMSYEFYFDYGSILNNLEDLTLKIDQHKYGRQAEEYLLSLLEECCKDNGFKEIKRNFF